MPLTPGAPASKTIPELHTGKTYSHTLAKFGKKRANAQAIAIAMSNERKGRAMGGAMMTAPGTVMNNMMAQASNPMMPQGVPQNNGVAPNPPQANPAINASAGVSMPPAPMMGPPTQMNASAPLQQGIGVPMQLPSSQPSAFPMRKKGGKIEGRAFGGAGLVKTPTMNPTWQERSEAHSMTRGPILSNVPGRTDAHFTHVPSGSFVIPADIVSGHGEGNTLAGANALQKMFKMGPYGSSMPKMGGGRGLPHPPAIGKMMSGGGKGGTDKNVGTPVPVKLAGGEIVVPPENLMAVVHPNLKHAHNIMDAWVVLERKKLRKTLAKLPGPARD